MASVLTGTEGGDASDWEEENNWLLERAKEAKGVGFWELERSSIGDLDVDGCSASKTREPVLSAVRNWRIWSLFLLRSSRVIPSEFNSCDIGEVWGFAIGDNADDGCWMLKVSRWPLGKTPKNCGELAE